MSVPDFQSLMLPTLKALADGSEAPVKDIRARVATSENLTPEDVQEMLPNGRQAVFVNRIGWAIFYMERAGLLERTRRGVYRLMSEGSSLLSQNPSRIDLKLLQQYPSYAEWKGESPSDKEVVNELPIDLQEIPDEAIETSMMLHFSSARRLFKGLADLLNHYGAAFSISQREIRNRAGQFSKKWHDRINEEGDAFLEIACKYPNFL